MGPRPLDGGRRTAVIIPALDEEEAIGAVLAEIPAVVSEVIVVDNGSTDRTAERAEAAGARVVREPRRGYGQACHAGIAAADKAEILVFLDADHSDYPEEMADLVAPLLRGEADLVIGSRIWGARHDPRAGPGSSTSPLDARPLARRQSAHPWHAVWGTRLCVGLMNLLVGTRATDLGPFRAITAEALRRLEMSDRTFGWTVEMQIKAAQRGLRVVEVPVHYRARIGRSKISGTLGGSLRAGAKILGTIARHALRS